MFHGLEEKNNDGVDDNLFLSVFLTDLGHGEGAGADPGIWLRPGYTPE